MNKIKIIVTVFYIVLLIDLTVIFAPMNERYGYTESTKHSDIELTFTGIWNESYILDDNIDHVTEITVNKTIIRIEIIVLSLIYFAIMSLIKTSNVTYYKKEIYEK